ncbi:MAG: Carbohydrate-selective porin [Phycisphaerales bacterium]|nr:Carbohydrate-selective porin [Phycisphaerales bacterium]
MSPVKLIAAIASVTAVLTPAGAVLGQSAGQSAAPGSSAAAPVTWALVPPPPAAGPATPDRPPTDTPGPDSAPTANPTTAPADEDRLDLKLLGWFGARSYLADRGLVFDISLTADESKNLRGGADTNHDVFRHLFDFRATLDTKKVGGWDGGTFSVDFQNQSGRNGTDLYGDAQGFDNADADGRTQISELWYEQIFGDTLRLKVGKVDANTEFAAVAAASEFINSSFGYSPTITGLPTYPDPAASFNIFYTPVPWFYVQYGVYDGGDGETTGNHSPRTLWRQPADFFHIAEAGFHWTCGDGTLPGHAAVGVSYANGRFERFRGGQQNGTQSIYALVEQKLIHTVPSEKDNERGLYAFAQFGSADEEVNDFRQHIGAGVTWVGPYAADNLDAVGLAFSTVFFSDATGSPYTQDSETSIEAFYNFQATNYLSIKPDLQYVIHPGGDAELKDALIATLRVTLAL